MSLPPGANNDTPRRMNCSVRENGGLVSIRSNFSSVTQEVKSPIAGRYSIKPSMYLGFNSTARSRPTSGQ